MVITAFILMTSMFDQVVVLQGENWGLKGLVLRLWLSILAIEKKH